MRLLAKLTLALVLGGCGPKLMGYHSTGQMVEIDPASGDTLITEFWTFSDGERTATFKRIPRGNTDTRREAPPPIGRFAD
jgi:hypothetical protein